MDDQPALSLRGVVVPGLDGSVSFDLAAGDCVALLDERADARTALLQIIVGLTVPTHGTVQAGAVAALWRDDSMPENEPVITAVRNTLTQLGSGTKPHELLEGIRLSHRAEHEPWAMSLGERRKIAIEVTLSAAAAVVVLDQPERGLDANALRWLAERVQQVTDERRVVVMATHDAALAEACGDYVIDDLETLTE